MLYAQLELDHDYLRAITPYYSVYSIYPHHGWALIAKDTSQAACAIRSFWVPKNSKGNRFFQVRFIRLSREFTQYLILIRDIKIDVPRAASYKGIDREVLSQLISQWDADGEHDAYAVV